MLTAPEAKVARSAEPSLPDPFWQRLFYRWFIQYNPLYLLSATLVLAGCSLWSRGLAQEDTLAGPLGIAFVAELYACSLVLGAALLWRIGFRRPAVLLALLFLPYQWDTTLHTETCAYLGTPGAVATAFWFALFVGKLYALAWALRLRWSRRFFTAAIVAALGLALVPRWISELGAQRSGALVAVWIFALGSLYRPGGITSTETLDAWGETVLRRATRAAWCVSGALVGLHVLMWWRDHSLSLAALAFGLPLLAIQRFRSERHVWVTAVGAGLCAAVALPASFSVTALLAAAALLLRALAPVLAADPSRRDGSEAARAEPYRASETGETRARTAPEEPSPLLTWGEQGRLVAGSTFAGYLALWTARWSSGPWPAHVVALDLAFGVVVALTVWRTRHLWPLAPLVVSYAHLVIASRLIPVPKSSAAWGETIVAAGFVMLAASLLTTYCMRSYGRPREA